MKYLLLIISINIFSVVLGQNPIEKEGWDLTFNDEFNDQKLDYSKWLDRHYWGGRFTPKTGMTYYGKDQFQFTDSTLLIVADSGANDGNMPYRAGMIDCNRSFKQQYGYFEIRSKNPKGTGFWPAFWLASTEKWPPEVDIYEFYTNEPTRIKTNQHWLNRRGKKHMQPKGYKMKVDASDDFHTYAVEWTRKKMIWYCDNKKIKTSRKGMKYFKYKMHVIINFAANSMNEMNLDEAIFPNYFEIDYVRVYRKK